MIQSSTAHPINAAIFLICSMSPAAANAIDTENYRDSVESDASTEQTILEDAFVHLTKDAQSLGLVFDFDYSEIVEDTQHLLEFLNFISYLLPNTLYNHLKTDDHLKECVHRIITGSLGNGETVIQTYLSELGGLDGQPALLPDHTDMIDHYYTTISQTDIFTDYMKNLYQLIDTEHLTTHADAADHETYRTSIRTMIARFAEAVDVFENDPIFDAVCTIQSHLILDLIASDNFTAYNYLFNNDATTLPEDLVDSFTQKWYYYKVSHTWCAKYFSLRHMIPNDAQSAAMYCFLYAVNTTKTSFDPAADVCDTLTQVSIYRDRVASLYKD